MNNELEADNNQLERIIENARRQVEECREITARCNRKILQSAQSSIGPLGSELARSKLAAEAHLCHSDAKVRQAALLILVDGHRAEIPQICERIALCDEDPETSILALILLSQYYAGTSDERVANLFATLVGDESRSVDFRLSAYSSLFEITSQPTDLWPNMKMYLGEFRFPQDVDWAFVEGFLH